MPSPVSSAEFVDLVQKSGLVDEKRLAAYVDKLRADNHLPLDAKTLAAQTIQDGVLTHFQAEQILQGKWRRFNIGKYKVLERLGAGGMASVFLCEHQVMRRRVAIKVLPTAKASDPSSLARFHREAKAIAALDHPNIVRAYDIDQDDKLHFIVMEHVDGSSLQDIVKKAGPMDCTRAAHYIRQAALGLQHAHDAAGLVHRDVKPGNILVDRNGVVKVLDMGLARFFNDDEDMLTKKYDENVLGTADYLAPEQATDSHGVDIRADIYSLGATFYFCLTGRTPFAEGTVAQKLIWHQTRLPKPIRGFRPDVPEELIAVIDRAMAKDATQRFQLPIDFAESLDPWTQSPIPPPPLEEMPQLSIAAMGGSAPDSNQVITRGGPAGEESPSSRKVWQVPGTTPTPRSNAKAGSGPSPIATPPRGNVPQRPNTPPTVVVPPVQSPTVSVQAKRPAAPADRPTAIANGRVRPAAAAKAGVASVEDPDALAAPADQTVDNHAVSTPRVEPKKKPVAPRPVAPLAAFLADRPPLFWGLVAGGVLAGVLFLGTLTWLIVHVIHAANPATTGAASLTHTVGGPNDKTIEQVLARARSNDHIVLNGDIQASGVSVKWPNLVIESAPGHTFTWSSPDNAYPTTALLNAENVEGVVIRNIKFNGRNKVDTLVQLRGRCPGLTLENLTLTDFKQAGVRVTSAEGMEARPILFTGLKMTHDDSKNGILFDVFAEGGVTRLNRWFKVTNCKSNNGKLKALASPSTAVANFDPADLFK